MTQLFSNNAYGALSANLAIGATSLPLVTGQGARFPSPSGGDFFLLTLIGVDSNGIESLWEIVKVTARSGDTLTIVKGQEGTNDAAWPSGTRVEGRDTAASRSDPQLATLSVAGDVTLTGASQRIRGDFSNSITGSRTLFQTTTADAITNVGAIPNGAGTSARLTVFGSSDPTNASSLNISQITNTESRIVAGRQGTGSYCPMTFYTNNTEAVRIDLSGNVGINAATPNLSTSSRALTLSAGTSGDATAALELQGSRTVTSGNFGIIHFYHQSNKVASVSAARGPVGDEGMLKFWTKATTAGIGVRGAIDDAGAWYFGGDIGADKMRLDSGGNLALGTVGLAPTSTLHVSTNQGTSKLLNDYGNGAFGLYSQTPAAGLGMTSRILMGYSDAGAFAAIGADYEAFGGTTSGGAIVFGTGTNGRSSITEKARITRYGKFQYQSSEFKVSALGSISGTNTIDLATAGEYTATIAGTTTFAFSNAPPANKSQIVLLRLTNAGSAAITWPASTKFAGGALGTLTAAGVDLLGVKYDATTSTYMVGAIWKDIK